MKSSFCIDLQRFMLIPTKFPLIHEKAAPDTLPMGIDAQDVTRKVEYSEVQRIRLCPAEGKYGCQVPKGAWHTVEVIEPSVIFEAKDGAYKG